MSKYKEYCSTCLSEGRNLTPARLFSSFFQEFGNIEIEDNCGLCWECKSMILKYHRFKHQVQIVQDIMQQKEGVNGIAKHNRDNEIQIVNEQNRTNKTLKEDKTNANIHTKELLSKNDANVTLKNFNREHRTIEAKHNRVRIEKEVDKSPQKEFEEKFESILLSEEELSRSREEKRNHPNFKKVPYKCDSCVLGFLTKENYDLHLAKKHDKKIGPFVCSVCNIRFPYLRSMNNHKSKHYAVYRCKLCKYKTVELHSAMNHCKVKHKRDSAGSLHCTQCLSICKTPQDLDEHMRREHAFCCNECGTKFKGKHTLRSHKARVHAIKREYSCELCRKTFKRQSRLESHMAGHEAAVARRLAYCSICDIQYKNIYVYRSHLGNSVHHAETLYPCSECDKKFASKVYRTNHYNFYHLQKTKYKCDLCNKLLISAWRLKNHKQKYHGLTRPREHSCNLCDKKFFTLATLRGHVLTHSKERSFMCEDCGDTFKQKPALYTHSRQVHRGGRKVK
ncbi:hypothetical protein K1T71_015185 [Dendrolimus kikuchii]|nr:hypothetical protein K1T71_015185 [Dendrolimus kikuchii]